MHRLKQKRRKKKRNIKNSLRMVCMPDMKFYRACIFFLRMEILSTRRKHRENVLGMEGSVKNNVDTLVFHTAICAEASQIAWMHRAKTALLFFARAPSANASEWRVKWNTSIELTQ